MEILFVVFKVIAWLCLVSGALWGGVVAFGRDPHIWRKPRLHDLMGPFFVIGFGLFMLMFDTFARPAVLSAQTAQAELSWRVIDGDTAEVSGVTFRIPNMDSPEPGWRAKCPAERALGKDASVYARTLFEGAQARRPAAERPYDTDRYGRALSDILLDGVSFKALMIAAGYAREWDYGREPKPDWCMKGAE